MQRWLTNYFGFTSLRKELLAGFTTFITMSYIVVVNPLLLKDAGMDPGSVFVATCLIAAVSSLLMGAYTNYPIALAPGLAITIYFSYVVVGQLGYSWQEGLGAIFIASVLFLIVSVLGLRTYIIEAIPDCVKIGLTCGIGVFIGVIALKNAQIIAVVPGQSMKWLQPFAIPGLLTYLGLAILFVFHRFKVPGSILLAIIILSFIGYLCHLTQYQGLFSTPPSIQPTLFALQVHSILQPTYWSIILSVFFVAFFDATGTLLALLHQAGLPNHVKNSQFGRALTVDSGSAILGTCLGTASVGAYVENAAGIVAGGRTGLTAITVGLLFLATLFFSPLAKTIPSFATAAALLYVACLMMKNVNYINWRDPAAAISTAVTIMTIPITFSIVYGIAGGFIAYLLVKVIQGQARTINHRQWGLGLFFSLYVVAEVLGYIK